MDARCRHFVVGCLIGILTSGVLQWRQGQLHGLLQNLTEARAALSNREVSHVVYSASNLSSTLLRNRPPNAGGAPVEDSSMAFDLYSRVRVLCWILTSPATLKTRAAQVKDTWGKQCNKLLFMSSENDTLFPAINLGVPEGRAHLTGKTMHAFKYVYDHHFDDADWFLKADDDTFVVVDNLRLMLATKNPNEPVFYGHHFKTIVKPHGYMSGGAGYVLSREALKRYAERGHHRPGMCREDGGAEDVAIGQCLQNLGVTVGESYDSSGRSRFHCFTPAGHMHGPYPAWYRKFDGHGAKLGVDGISDSAITFHYVSPRDMVNLDFLVNRFKPYGVDEARPVRYHQYYSNRP